jgi:hypothetical protein
MTKYWVIPPYDSTRPKVFERAWAFDHERDLIALDWHDLGDVSLMSEAQLRDAIEKVHPDNKTQYAFNCLWTFYHRVQVGDVILARKGRKTILDIGTVIRSAFFDDSLGRERTGVLTDDYYPHFLGVHWQKTSFIEFPRIVFGMGAISETSESRYSQLVEGASVIPGEPIEDVENRAEFELEKYLEDFTVHNFDSIFRGQLKLYRDEEGNVGQQYPTDVGPIDILATNASTGDFVVIELKKGKSSDVVVGQTLRYMGWVRDNLCNDGQEVRGRIICKDKDLRLEYALGELPRVDVKFYVVNFHLSDAPAGVPSMAP